MAQSTNFPVPENETQRLRALESYDVIGTAPEPAFNELADLAGRICECPIAVINLVADTWEWYKGKCGLSEDFNREPRGGPCSTAICGTDLLLVPDMSEDDRFADEELVKGEPYFRFYAGMPLINPEGYALGSICVLDFKPREGLSHDQIETLQCLSHQAMAQLELRRKLIELNEAQQALAVEKGKSDELLLNILPSQIADELKQKGHVEPRYYDSATIMFTDFKGFTGFAETLEPRSVVDELNQYFSEFDDIVGRHKLEKIKTIGDAYLCVGGLPGKNRSHPVDVCLAALEIRDFIERTNEQRNKMRLPPWELRIGIHTGAVMAGVVGKRKFTYDIWGDAVNVAALMESNGKPGRINLSESTYRQVEGFFETERRDFIEAKNKGRLQTYFLTQLKPEFSQLLPTQPGRPRAPVPSRE